MKIFLLSTFFHPVTGGVETHVYDLAKQLIERGNEVEVLCSDSTKIGPRLKEKVSNISGIKIHRFFTIFSLSYYHKFYPGLFFYLMRNDFDVIHIHGFRKFDTYLALFVAWRKKKKVVLTSHNPFPTKNRSRFSEFLISIHDATLGKWFTKKLYKIIVLVDAEKKIFIDKFHVDKEKLVTIPDALGDRFYKVGNPQQFYKDWDIDPTKWNSIVVSAGRLNQEKGFQNLYTAVKELPKVLFFIAGGNDGYLDRLKALYANCPNIIFTEHFMPAEKLINMYAGSDLFVFPSLHEAFGMVLLEAIAQGKPVISTNVGGPADFVTEDFGILTDPSDQNKWKVLIKDMLSDKDRIIKMGERAKEVSLKYNWSKQISKIIKAYS